MSVDTHTTTPGPTAFPAEGTPECDRFLAMADDGRIVLGVNEAGEEAIWDMNTTAHALLAGPTGSGKTVAATIPVYAALRRPDVFDLVVIEKTGEFTWASQFPNVRHVDAAGAAECIAQLRIEMDNRYKLLARHGSPNLKIHRATTSSGQSVEGGSVPKRLLVVVGEIGYLNLSDEAQADLESIAAQSRASEINLLVTAQHPSAVSVSPALRSLIAFTMVFGHTRPLPADVYGAGAAAASESGSLGPRGRAWVETHLARLRDPLVAVPFLPRTTVPAPWDPSLVLDGVLERVKASRKSCSCSCTTSTTTE